MIDFKIMDITLSVIRKTLKGKKQTNVEWGQSGTSLRLTRASSGPRVNVAKTYRDDNIENFVYQSTYRC